MVRRGQVSLEFVMIVGIALILLVSSTYFVFRFTQQQTDQSNLQQVALVGYKIVEQATNMYVYGEGSFVTVTGNLPSKIHDMYVVEQDTLVIEVETLRGIVSVPIFSDIPINGTYGPADYYTNPTHSTESDGTLPVCAYEASTVVYCAELGFQNATYTSAPGGFGAAYIGGVWTGAGCGYADTITCLNGKVSVAPENSSITQGNSEFRVESQGSWVEIRKRI